MCLDDVLLFDVLGSIPGFLEGKRFVLINTELKGYLTYKKVLEKLSY